MKLQAFFNEKTDPSLPWNKRRSWKQAWGKEGRMKGGEEAWREEGMKEALSWNKGGGDSKEDFPVKMESWRPKHTCISSRSLLSGIVYKSAGVVSVLDVYFIFSLVTGASPALFFSNLLFAFFQSVYKLCWRMEYGRDDRGCVEVQSPYWMLERRCTQWRRRRMILKTLEIEKSKICWSVEWCWI